ncbi:MAG: O-antigen ligase family protein [Sterolibacterium sp.]
MKSYTSTIKLAGAWCAIALGFAIPVSTAASNLLFALVIVCFLLSGDYREKYRALAANPVVLAILLFCAAAALGCAYGAGSVSEKMVSLGKYLTLLMVPVLIPLLDEQKQRIRALAAFSAAMLLTLALSYLIHFEWFPSDLLIVARERDPASWGAHNPVVFKLHITHNFLMAFTAFLLAVAARHVTSPRLRWVAASLSILAAGNVLLMVKGRTGYAILALLAAYFIACRYGRKGLAAAAVAVLLLGAVAYQGSSTFQERIDVTIAQAGAWHPGQGGEQNSISQRLDFYTNSIAIIRDHPFFGVGIGGFDSAYAERVRGTSMVLSSNPHNQYLMIAAQLGLAGLALLAWLYYTYWRQATPLTEPFGQIARGVLLAMLLGNLFNSFMADFTERMFFAWISGVLFAELSARRAPPGPA